MGLLLRALPLGESPAEDVVTFVELPIIPDGVDGIQAHGIEYVERVAVEPLPAGVDAVRMRGVAFVPPVRPGK
jgi:hypothetical protein